MRKPLLALALSLVALTANAATQQEISDFLERLQKGDLDANVLLYPTADRRIAFAHINAWMPTRPLFPAETPYALSTEIDVDLEKVSYQVDGETFTVGDFLKREPLMGMAVVEGDTISSSTTQRTITLNLSGYLFLLPNRLPLPSLVPRLRMGLSAALMTRWRPICRA